MAENKTEKTMKTTEFEASEMHSASLSNINFNTIFPMHTLMCTFSNYSFDFVEECSLVSFAQSAIVINFVYPKR